MPCNCSNQLFNFMLIHRKKAFKIQDVSMFQMIFEVYKSNQIFELCPFFCASMYFVGRKKTPRFQKIRNKKSSKTAGATLLAWASRWGASCGLFRCTSQTRGPRRAGEGVKVETPPTSPEVSMSRLGTRF